VDDSDVESLKANLSARLKCSIIDSGGRSALQIDVALKDMIWSSPIHGRSGYALYQLEGSEFVPNKDATYTMSVEYSGDAQLAGKKGSLYLWCGCGGS
jgi:hypothetical protein